MKVKLLVLMNLVCLVVLALVVWGDLGDKEEAAEAKRIEAAPVIPYQPYHHYLFPSQVEELRSFSAEERERLTRNIDEFASVLLRIDASLQEVVVQQRPDSMKLEELAASIEQFQSMKAHLLFQDDVVLVRFVVAQLLDELEGDEPEMDKLGEYSIILPVLFDPLLDKGEVIRYHIFQQGTYDCPPDTMC